MKWMWSATEHCYSYYLETCGYITNVGLHYDFVFFSLVLQDLLQPFPGDLCCPQYGSGCCKVEPLSPKGFHLLQFRLDHQDLGPHHQVRLLRQWILLTFSFWALHILTQLQNYNSFLFIFYLGLSKRFLLSSDSFSIHVQIFLYYIVFISCIKMYKHNVRDKRVVLHVETVTLLL